MKSTCVVVDDEPLAVRLLVDYISKTASLELVGEFSCAIEALEFLENHPVDIAFLDINMPKLDGMELAALLGKNQKIIFTTAHSKHAAHSYDLGAIDYLLKPITFERFAQALSKLRLSYSHWDGVDDRARRIFVKSGKSYYQLIDSQVIYIEGLRDYVKLVTVDRPLIILKTMMELESSLPRNFVRVHNSWIVNLDHVLKVEDNQVHLQGIKIPVGSKYREDLHERIRIRLM